MILDLLIIGGGPAGMAAGIQAARLGLKTAVVERDRLGGQALAAPWIENYPGFPEGISGKELMGLFEQQLNKWRVPVIYKEVTDLDKIPAKYILLALGLTPKTLGLPNEIPYGNPNKIDHAGKSVLIVGGGDSAFDLAASFAKKARRVTIGMRGKTPRALPALVNRASALGVKIESLSNDLFTNFDLIISCIGKEVKHPILNKIKEAFGPFELKAGEVKNIPHLFFAGDVCRGQDRHIAIAVGDGIFAAQKAHQYNNENHFKNR